MTINLQVPSSIILKPCITVFGVGGAGGNAVNNMISSSLEGVKFVIANTDAQALEHSLAERRIQLGEAVTRGLGAGANPEVGKGAAEESLEEILDALEGSNMVFITAGMGGGTGTGAAPVIAQAARERDILTVGVVTKPFHFEGAHRMRIADAGLEALQQYVDTLIVIPNQNLFRIANEKTTFADAFKMADDVLHAGVRGVTDLMVMPGLINLDFSDIRTVMKEMGKAMMGTGEAAGDGRALHAAEAAISNPLLDNVSMQGARGVLINITGGSDMTLFEVDEAANRIRDEVEPDANIIFGSTFNADLDGSIRVSVVATGIDTKPVAQQETPKPIAKPAPEPIVHIPNEPEAPTFASTHYQTIPSMQEPATAIQPQTEVQYTPPQPEQHETFVAPPPVNPYATSPHTQPTQPTSAPPRPTVQTAPNIPVTTQHAVSSTPSPLTSDVSSSLGLFGRMANSVHVRTDEVVPQPSSPPVSSETPHDDTLEMPAFLRRKKKVVPTEN